MENKFKINEKVMIMGGHPTIRGYVGFVSSFDEDELTYCYVSVKNHEDDSIEEFHVKYNDLQRL